MEKGSCMSANATYNSMPTRNRPHNNEIKKAEKLKSKLVLREASLFVSECVSSSFTIVSVSVSVSVSVCVSSSFVIVSVSESSSKTGS